MTIRYFCEGKALVEVHKNLIFMKEKIFYAQVKAYKLIDGNKFYGSWSAKG